MSPADDIGDPSARTFPSLFREIGAQIRPAVLGLISLTVLTGCLFPLALFGLGRWLSPDQAEGSLVRRGGVVVGSRLIGQGFARAGYFHPRGSAAGASYDAIASGGTNFGPSNPKLIESVRRSAAAYRRLNGLAPGAAVPVDAVTSSGSGLDPQISPWDAALQTPRVARARGLSADVVSRRVAEHTEGRQLGFMGEPRVSVLELNLALDRARPSG